MLSVAGGLDSNTDSFAFLFLVFEGMKLDQITKLVEWTKQNHKTVSLYFYVIAAPNALFWSFVWSIGGPLEQMVDARFFYGFFFELGSIILLTSAASVAVYYFSAVVVLSLPIGVFKRSVVRRFRRHLLFETSTKVLIWLVVFSYFYFGAAWIAPIVIASFLGWFWYDIEKAVAPTWYEKKSTELDLGYLRFSDKVRANGPPIGMTEDEALRYGWMLLRRRFKSTGPKVETNWEVSLKDLRRLKREQQILGRVFSGLVLAAVLILPFFAGSWRAYRVEEMPPVELSVSLNGGTVKLERTIIGKSRDFLLVLDRRTSAVTALPLSSVSVAPLVGD